MLLFVSIPVRNTLYLLFLMFDPADLTIHLATTVPDRALKAENLAESLHIPITYEADNATKYSLIFTDNYIKLQCNPASGRGKISPIFVEFSRKGKLHPRLASTTVRDPLPRAIGIKKGFRPTVLDATAGLGMDGMSMAWLGCQVTMVERSPIIYTLLEDGLKRGYQNLYLSKIIEEKIELLYHDSIAYLPGLQEKPDVIYVDPMFPDLGSKALGKGEMRVIKDIVGSDADGTTTLTVSLMYAKKRVVVKRPKGAPLLPQNRKPDYSQKTKSGRFDIYLTSHL